MALLWLCCRYVLALLPLFCSVVSLCARIPKIRAEWNCCWHVFFPPLKVESICACSAAVYCRWHVFFPFLEKESICACFVAAACSVAVVGWAPQAQPRCLHVGLDPIRRPTFGHALDDGALPIAFVKNRFLLHCWSLFFLCRWCCSCCTATAVAVESSASHPSLPEGKGRFTW